MKKDSRLFIVGDVHGCLECLQKLLAHIDFNRGKDTLLFTGDLVNRGPSSLETLRFVKELSENGRCTAVLGNHDLHLLGRYAAQKQPAEEPRKEKPQLMYDVLSSSDAPAIMEWLRHRKLMYYDKKNHFILVHAGLIPVWTISEALAMATEVENELTKPDWRRFIQKSWRGNSLLDHPWSTELKGTKRAHFITSVFTRIRNCQADGIMDFQSISPKNRTKSPQGFQPWYEWRHNRGARGPTVLFGHWSMLGFKRMVGAISLDSGCVWGGQLTAVEWYSKNAYHVGCDAYAEVKIPGSLYGAR